MAILPALSLNLGSPEPERLIAFYRDTLGLTPAPEMSPGAFALGSGFLIVSGHSEVTGPATDPVRYLINFVVTDLDGEQARLETAGVEFVRSKGEEPWGGRISTFLDPDGNYCQLIETPEPRALGG